MEKMNFKWINRPSQWVGFWAMLMFGQMVFAQAPTTWTHPGGNNNKADLDYVKSKIAAGEQPWTTRYAQIVAIATPGVATIPADENGMKAEGRKAYANALAWYYSGNVTYANNAIAILNNWGNNFTGFGAPGGQNLLVGGWIGALLGPAAEIMRGYAGWTPAQILVVQNMFRTRFYPVLNQMSTWNGNVDLTQIDAMLNIAVFNEDATLFNSAISRLRLRNPAYFYLSTDPAASRNYATITSQSWNAANWVNGLTQETCRTGGNYNGNGNDNGHHAQYALASAIHAAEVAWNQGVDIYGENETRYIAALELLSTQLYTGSMQN
ncbi:MAG: alginate lyase family protein, partial [Cytophagales bacterium]|nr:alginate lyase family protein [Cytophagales bacterium]